jgi:hypothetical protein
MARRKTKSRKPQSLELVSAVEALRTALPYWHELCQAHFAELEEVRHAKEHILTVKINNSGSSDAADDPINNAKLRSAQGRVKRGVRTAKAYGKVVKIIEATVPVVAVAAEQAGMDAAPLLLFAADMDPRYWQPARALVEQLFIMHSEEKQPLRQSRRRAAAIRSPKKTTAARAKVSPADG